MCAFAISLQCAALHFIRKIYRPGFFDCCFFNFIFFDTCCAGLQQHSNNGSSRVMVQQGRKENLKIMPPKTFYQFHLSPLVLFCHVCIVVLLKCLPNIWFHCSCSPGSTQRKRMHTKPIQLNWIHFDLNVFGAIKCILRFIVFYVVERTVCHMWNERQRQRETGEKMLIFHSILSYCWMFALFVICKTNFPYNAAG